MKSKVPAFKALATMAMQLDYKYMADNLLTLLKQDFGNRPAMETCEMARFIVLTMPSEKTYARTIINEFLASKGFPELAEASGESAE